MPGQDTFGLIIRPRRTVKPHRRCAGLQVVPIVVMLVTTGCGQT